MNYQKHLNEQSKWILENLNIDKLRGVIGKWNNEKELVDLSFYFNGQPTEEEIEEASVACTEIIATFPIGSLEEKYIRLDYPETLPESEFWVYRKKE